MKMNAFQPAKRGCTQYGPPGFTLVELMIVIIVVSILAAVLMPIMQGRAIAGTIKTGLRAYYVENGPDADEPDAIDLGFGPGDLDGKYFKYSEGAFMWTSSYSGDPEPVLKYTITITSPFVIAPPVMYLTEEGFSQTP